MIEIQLIERGPSELVPSSIWRSAALEEPMKILASRGIVRLTRTAVGVLLTPRHYVGEMLLPDAVLRVLPKSVRILSAMNTLALSARVKTANHFQIEDDGDRQNEVDPVQKFVGAFLDSVNEGIPWVYGVRTSATSFPRGRIEFGRTVRDLASRGVRHRVVAAVPIHLQDHEFVRVVRAALDCLPGIRGATIKHLADAQMLSSALDTVEPFQSLEQAVNNAVALTNRLDHSARPAAKELAIRSAAILKRELAIANNVEHVPGGIAKFQDLEELWERCTQYLIDCWMKDMKFFGEPILHDLRSSDILLFEDGGPKIDPDIIVRNGMSIKAVFDAKYKSLDFGSSGTAADLYQLTSYVRRLAAKVGALIYFSEGPANVTVSGTTPEGAPILVVSISADLLLSEGGSALTRLLGNSPALSERLKQGFAHSLRHEGSNGVPNLPGNVLLGTQKLEMVGK